MSEIILKTADDPENLLRLVLSVGWNQTIGDCSKMVGKPDCDCIYACDGNEKIGCGAVQLYGDHEMAFINMVVVSEPYRKRGIATQMLQYFMEKYRDWKTLRLYASTAGSYVYTKLGFRNGPLFHKYNTPAATAQKSPADILPLTAADMKAAADLDAASFGIRRESTLEYFRALMPQLAFKKIRPDGSLSGLAIGREGPNARHVAAISAACEEDALELFNAVATAGTGPRSSLMVVPDSAVPFIRLIEKHGFIQGTPLLSMDYGKPGPGIAAKYFAALGGDFG